MTRMYEGRVKKGNVPGHRGCKFDCVYCRISFQRLVKLNKRCPKCATFEPHSHLEALDKVPPKTGGGEFVTFGLSGDVSFLKDSEWLLVWAYLGRWMDRTFLLQSKDPACFLPWRDIIPQNVIIGTTIETDAEQIWVPKVPFGHAQYIHYNEISKAPLPVKRAKAMAGLGCRKAVTIEPVMSFDQCKLLKQILHIDPEIVWVGYANDNHDGKKLKLPEPSLGQTQAFLNELRTNGIDVREKTLRPAWWEGAA